jgi:hypothetical protein
MVRPGTAGGGLPQAPGRGGEYAAALLKGYTGVLQTDGYAVYRSLADPKRADGPVTLAFCWALWRRQWFDMAKSPPAPIATEALKRIAELYTIEAEIRGKRADERRAVRQEKTRPLIAALGAWLERTLPKVAGGSSIAQAIRYALNHLDGLVRFLDDGRIQIDSDTAERSMRPVVLNRKNALFAGSDESRKLGIARLADRNLQTARRRPASLSERRADEARQQLAQQPTRGTDTLGLGRPAPLIVNP